MKHLIRLQSIELENFKNISYGKIIVEETGKQSYHGESKIIGIYGQNGSGKTAVIESFRLLKQLLTGSAMKEDVFNYIKKDQNNLTCTYRFYIKEEKDVVEESIVDYAFTISKHKEYRWIVTKEKVVCRVKNEERWMPAVTLGEYEIDQDQMMLRPKQLWRSVVQENKKYRIDLEIAKRITQKEHRSFLFSLEIRNMMDLATGARALSFVLNRLCIYGQSSLFVVDHRYSGAITMDLLIPMLYSKDNHQREVPKKDQNNEKELENKTEDYLLEGIPISLVEPTVLEGEDYQTLDSLISLQNLVLQSLIPGLSLFVKEYGPQMTLSGKEGMRFEILSKRDSVLLPLRFESEGIKKLLSVLSLLISMYHHPSMCVVIDELDAGIYEYLLGELLMIIEQGGKGQLIFTSHNLRPLEMIKNDSLVFTTANPNNRYIKFSSIKNYRNLRDLYLRSIHLGGQKEKIYENTNSYEISRAFRKAGRVTRGED